jgi:hypothetical protein
MKKLFRFETLIFLSIWLLLMLRGPSRLFRDPGTFFHTRVGEYILTSGHLPQTDIFSFTLEGKPWIAHQWLGECIMGFIHRLMGLDGLLLATAALLAWLFAWISHRLIRSGMHFMLVTLIVSLALAASAIHLHVRPHIVSILFMALIFSRLSDFEAGRLNFWGLFWLIPIFIIWTNIHGGVLGGLATLALMISGWTLARIFRRESPLQSLRQMLRSWGFLILCVLAIFVNPYWVDLPKSWLSIMNSHIIPNIIQEHSSAFRGQYGWIIFPLGFFFIFSLIGTLPKSPRISWLIPLIWLALALSRVRHAPLFAVVAAIALADLFPYVRWAKWLVGKGSKVFRLSPISKKAKYSFKHGCVPCILIVIAISLQITSIKAPVLGRDWVKIDQRYWPIDLVPQLRSIEGDKLGGIPILNDMLFGGFLIYYTPNLRVFIDDRCELYGDEGLLAYVNADCNKFEYWSKKYDVSLALTQPGSAMDICLKKAGAWRMVRSTIPAALYQRADFEFMNGSNVNRRDKSTRSKISKTGGPIR